MKDSKVSIIMPAYNASAFLERSITSVEIKPIKTGNC